MKNYAILLVSVLGLMFIGAGERKTVTYAIAATSAADAAKQVNSWASKGYHVKLVNTQLVKQQFNDGFNDNKREWLVIIEN